jgi:hypothetical protein
VRFHLLMYVVGEPRIFTECYSTVHIYIVLHFSDSVWCFWWKRIYFWKCCKIFKKDQSELTTLQKADLMCHFKKMLYFTNLPLSYITYTNGTVCGAFGESESIWVFVLCLYLNCHWRSNCEEVGNGWDNITKRHIIVPVSTGIISSIGICLLVFNRFSI